MSLFSPNIVKAVPVNDDSIYPIVPSIIIGEHVQPLNDISSNKNISLNDNIPVNRNNISLNDNIPVNKDNRSYKELDHIRENNKWNGYTAIRNDDYAEFTRHISIFLSSNYVNWEYGFSSDYIRRALAIIAKLYWNKNIRTNFNENPIPEIADHFIRKIMPEHILYEKNTLWFWIYKKFFTIDEKSYWEEYTRMEYIRFKNFFVYKVLYFNEMANREYRKMENKTIHEQNNLQKLEYQKHETNRVLNNMK